MLRYRMESMLFFFFNDTATTEIYTLSLHDALPICPHVDDADAEARAVRAQLVGAGRVRLDRDDELRANRSEEHTSELQSQSNLVCRLLLEKKTEEHFRLPTPRRDIACTLPFHCPSG